MLGVVTFKWSQPGYHTKFDAQHVNVVYSTVRRNYRRPFRFLCVTDDPAGLHPDIVAVPLWSTWGDVPNPSGPHAPSCYRRLRLFAPDAAETFGERFVCLDLDCVGLRDLVPTWDRPEDFVIWRDPNASLSGNRFLYCGSMFLLTAGTRTQVWEAFDPVETPRLTREEGRVGSDQAVLSKVLGPGEACWTVDDGVVSYRRDVMRQFGGEPRDKDVLVFFHGKINPWSKEAQRLPWVQEHYR
jgi:hypothetical protein